MSRRPVLYPRLHPWYLMLATADVLLTWLILTAFDGVELNPIAAKMIDWQDKWGALALKFATVMFVMWVCEFVGQRKRDTGRTLLLAAVLLNCVPVGVSVAQLAAVH